VGSTSRVAGGISLGNGFIHLTMFWRELLAALIDHKRRIASVYIFILALLTFRCVIHSTSPDGLMYSPWTLTGRAGQIPFQFAAAYGVLGLFFVALSFTI